MGRYLRLIKYAVIIAVPISLILGVLIVLKFNKEAKAGKALHESEPEV